MLRMYTAHDMYLRNIRTLKLLGTCLNLVERHIPRIGIALPTAERAELTIEEADVRRLEMNVTVVVYRLSTRLTLTCRSKLTKQPQWSLTP